MEQTKIDSLILQEQEHVNFILSLVENKELHLIYRLSVHGERAQDYHAQCDGKFNCIFIIKSTKGKIFGGYRCTTIGTNT